MNKRTLSSNSEIYNNRWLNAADFIRASGHEILILKLIATDGAQLHTAIIRQKDLDPLNLDVSDIINRHARENPKYFTMTEHLNNVAFSMGYKDFHELTGTRIESAIQDCIEKASLNFWSERQFWLTKDMETMKRHLDVIYQQKNAQK